MLMFLSSSQTTASYFPTSCWKLHSLAAELRYALCGSVREVEVEQDGRYVVLSGYVRSEEARTEVCRLAHELAFGVPVMCMVVVMAEASAVLI